MLKIRYAAAIGLGALLLGACEHYGAESSGVSDGFELQRAAATSAPSSAFEAGLHAGYLDLAQAEFNRGDYEDSDRFARRAEAVADGKRVEPEHPITHRWIPEEHRAELFNEVWRLQKALRAGARDWAAEPAARAQVMYDCWVEEQEENFQPEDIAACRDAYLAAMAEVEALQPGEMMAEAMPAPGPYVVFFEFDSAILTAEARSTLDEVVNDAGAFEPAVVIVRGHTDRAGAEAYNMALSQRRAEAVSEYLQAHGIDAGSIAVDWFGESKPMIATADGVPEQANRRVEIEFEK
jgi:outer membrane protein OmpA-like peptidoglycan-associated protein